MNTSFNTHFRRFEFKYVMPRAVADRIIPQLLNYMELDKYSNDNGGYFVSSLYFDNRHLKCYHEKIDGLMNRKKLRLRTYGLNSENEEYFFFEIKRRKGAVVLKDRDFMKPKDMMNFFDDFPGFLNEKKGTSVFWDELFWEKMRYNLKPRMWVGYFRKAFYSRFDEKFRVTFDFDLSMSPVDGRFELPNYKNCLDDQVVMEVKFNGTMPHWFHEILEVYRCERTSFSKYCYCVERLIGV